MSTGLVRANSIVGLEAEVTEGTYVAPSGTGSYLRTLEGLSLKPSRELVERNLLTASPGKETPRMGIKSVAGQVPVEFRAGGVEGSAGMDFHQLLLGALGSSRARTASRITTKSSGNTSTVLQIEDADIADLNVGDCVLVLKSGAHEVRPIISKTTGSGTATVTLAWALDGGAPGNSVELAKFTTYKTADTGHPALSLSVYWANEIRQAGIGMKVTQMSLENFQPGKVASLNFALEGLNYTEVNGAAPHTPAYDTGVPPIILSACVWRDGVATPINNLGLGLTNELGFLTSTCSPNGRTASRVKSREIAGSINPYKDDTSTDYFDDFVAGTEFSIFAVVYNPSGTTGEMSLGSVVGIWLPQCIATEFETQDADGILVDNLPFRATRGAAGDKEELYMTFF